jgi:hypothetical protein
MIVSDLLPAIDFSDRVLQRTENWVSPAPNQFSTNPVAESDTVLEFGTHAKEPASMKIIPTISDKPKTQGITSLNDTIPEQIDIDRAEPQPTTQPTFKLKDRELKVFQTLFYQPCQANTPGQIKWLNFLHAISKTGFTYQKLGGSAWQFTPSSFRCDTSYQLP